MTEHASRRRAVDASVLAGSALILGCSGALVARVDSQAVVESRTVESRREASLLAPGAPIAGLVPARARQRRIVVRHSRAS